MGSVELLGWNGGGASGVVLLRLIYSLGKVLITICDRQRQVKGSKQWERQVPFASDQLQQIQWVCRVQLDLGSVN